MVISVTRGWVLLASKLTLAFGVPPPPTPNSMRVSAWALALISDLKVLVPPISATLSIPGVAVPPASQKVTLSLCVAPISVVKCALPGTPPGVTAVVQVPSKVTW